MLGQLILRIAFCRIRLQLGDEIPDSGQEHTAHSNDCFLVSTASLDPAIPVSACWVFVGFDDGVCGLNQKRLQTAACAGDVCRLHFLATLNVSRAADRPRNKVLRILKNRYIHANFRDQGNICQRGW